MTKRNPSRSAEIFGFALETGLYIAGASGIGLALVLGKFFLAALLALICFGIFLRFKRAGLLRIGRRQKKN